MQEPSGLLPWLTANKDPIQIFVTIIFGLSSSCLAIVALWVSYRNNFGWKPLVVIQSHGMGGGGTAGTVVTCKFQIWNRRKYPVVIKELQASWGETRLVSQGGYTPGQWGATRWGNYRLLTDLVVDANKSVDYDAAASLAEDQTGSLGNKPFEVWVEFYDPRKSRYQTVRVASHGRRSALHRLTSIIRTQMPRG